MKTSISKKTSAKTRPVSAAKDRAPKIQPVSKSKAPGVAKPPAAAAPPRNEPTTRGGAETAALLASLKDQLAAIRALVERSAAPAAAPAAGWAEETDAIRRLLNDLMERKMESVIRDVVPVRNDAASVSGDVGQRVTRQLDELLGRLGAVRFEAQRLDQVDVLIHGVAREVHEAQLPDGAIVETLRPGYRTGRGVVVAKALVAVNRRT